jgi:amidophosphoribosyltransferase
MRNQLASHVYDITYGSCARRQPRLCGRLDRARHDAATLDPAHPRPAAAEEDRHRLHGAADPLPGLLRHRHVRARQVHRLRGGGRAAQGTRAGRSCSRSVPPLPRRGAQGRSRTTTCGSIYEPFTPEEISQARSSSSCAEAQSIGRARSRSSSRRSRTCTPPCRSTPATGISPGKYPTPGGYRVVNQAYVNYYEKHEGRSYLDRR